MLEIDFRRRHGINLLFAGLVPVLLLMASLQATLAQQKQPGKKPGYKSEMESFRVKKKDFKKFRYLAFGAGLHLLNYFGDLAPSEEFLSTDLSMVKPGVSLFANYRYGPRMSVKATLMYGRLMGDDYSSADANDPAALRRYIRNLSFRNDVFDLSVTSQIYLYKNYLDFTARKGFNLYLTGGVSVFYHNPMGRIPEFKVTNERFADAGQWVALRPLGTEGQLSEFYDTKPYSNIQISIPVGMGMNFRINQRLDLDLELNYRILFTDYIDDVSGNYVDLGALDSDLAKTMSDRSREARAVVAEKPRDPELILGEVDIVTYISRFDGNRYTVFSGYGMDMAGRGGKGLDSFLISTIKVSYILNK
jgi:hypothetical protein